MMGLAAVVLGGLWRDAHLPIMMAAVVAVLLGLLGGGLQRITDHAAWFAAADCYPRDLLAISRCC